MDIAFSDGAHRALYARTSGLEPDQLRALWDDFAADHPQWAHYGSRWLRCQRHRSPMVEGVAWVTFPALDWLEEFLQPSMTVFEWGCGGSTLFFAQRVAHVTSVEHDRDWHGQATRSIRETGAANVDLRLVGPQPSDDPAGYGSAVDTYHAMSFERYARTIDAHGSFDLVLVDGRARMACLEHAVPHVRPGGAVVLDNSDYRRYQDRLPRIEEELAGWERVDLLGPGPCARIIGWRTTAWVRSVP